MQRVSPSSAVFASVMIAIGIWGLAQPRFVAIWAPGIQPAGLRAQMAIACSLISAVTGVGLLLPSYAHRAARILLGFVGIWLVWCKGTALIGAATDLALWESLGETAVVASAAWTLASFGCNPGDGSGLGRSGPRVLYGLALTAFGLSHLAYVTQTSSLVPIWLPGHVVWVYFTAATYFAAGAALVVGRWVRPAAVLSTLQMALFGLLVWLPRIAAQPRNSETMNETAISFALAASGWVVATGLRRPSIDPRQTDQHP